VDSAAIAGFVKPGAALFIDYGQGPARAERRASQRIANILEIPWSELSIDCREIGSETLLGRTIAKVPPAATWWPYRNQLLVTFAAAWALAHEIEEIMIGTVATDGEQHRDGSEWFLGKLDELLAGQEGAIRVRAPAVKMTTEALIEAAGAPRSLLAATYSCHVAEYPCGDCGGCVKRASVLEAVGL
jgi:7-cyano-7-deazaguanine synthase